DVEAVALECPAEHLGCEARPTHPEQDDVVRVRPGLGEPAQLVEALPHAQRLVKPAEPLGLVAPGPDGRVALPAPLDELTRPDHPPAFPPCNRLLLAANGA